MKTNENRRGRAHIRDADTTLCPATRQGGQALKKLNFNSYCALLFVALGGFIFLVIPTEIEKPMIIFGQSLNALDPKLFPSIVALAFMGLGAWGFIESFSMTERNELAELNREAAWNVGVTVGALIAYALLMVPLGFVPSSTIMVAGLSFFYGVRNLPLIAAISLGIPVFIYVVFSKGLKVFLPEIPWL